MSGSAERWSLPAEPQRIALATLLAGALFFGAWGLIHHGFYARGQILDTPFYERHGDAVAAGRVPYRDFGLEYPPAAVPVFVLPSLAAGRGDLAEYRHVFDALMAVCGAALAAIVAFTLVRAGARPRRIVAGVCLAALFPLALGSAVVSRYDLWPAVLVAAALAALVSGWERSAAGLLGLAAAAKVYPVALVPLGAAYVWKRSGRRAALVWLVVFGGIVLACLVPFLVLAPAGVWDSIVGQTTRPLQIESLGAAVLLAAHRLGALGITVESTHGSQNLAGPGPDVIGAIQSAVEIACLLAIWFWFARGPARLDRLIRASAATLAALIAFGKVLSPQFLIWLVPVVALVGGRRGLAAGALLLVAMVLTQVWFPYRYWRLAVDLDATASWLVLVRDVVLLGLLAVLVWPEGLRAPRRAVAR